MSEAESHPVAEPASKVPSVTGDPVAAAALARERAQTAWKWGWLCTLVAIASWVGFGVLVSLAGRAAGANDLTSGISLLVAVGSSIAACICFYRVYSQRRAAAMADACETMGFRFTEKVDKRMLATFTRIPLFHRGHSPTAYYAMEGEVGGWPVTAMQYSYTTGSGKSQHTHYQTVAIIHGADDLPDFELRPKSFWRKIGEALGLVSIKFANNPAFMSAYYLTGPDEKALRATFTPATLAWFAERRNWTVESQDSFLAVYQQDKACAADQYPQRVANALAMLRQLQGESTASELPEADA
jgi:hypothetical protein